MENDYLAASDCRLIREMLKLTIDELAEAIHVYPSAVAKWETNASYPDRESLDSLYSFAERKGLFLNLIKSQFHQESLTSPNLLLFHGSKSGIDGPVDLQHSKPDLDFGRGFYCGESLEQSAMFVVERPFSSLYFLSFNPEGLKKTKFSVDEEWMLTVAYFRGKMNGFEINGQLGKAIEKIRNSDYLIAPIADNRMYDIIDSYAKKLITDVQCLHSLSATDLGFQYVFLTPDALGHLSVLEHSFLCREEKERLHNQRVERNNLGEQKAHAALIKYRGKGKYIDEVFNERH
jgi:transcriptional regulator with XRE-family HTH domain